MDIIRRKIQEEGLACALANDAAGGLRKGIGEVLVLPARAVPTRHVADAADAIVQGVTVLAVRGAPPGLEQMRVRACRKLLLIQGRVARCARIAHADGVCGVKIGHHPILHVNTGHAVARSRHDEGFIKPHLARPGGNGNIPVNGSLPSPEPKVPLTHGRRAVTGLLHEGGQAHGLLLRGENELGISGQNTRPLLPPGILAGEQGEARRRTDRGRAVSITEHQPLICQAVKVRAGHLRTAIGRRIMVAKVIGKKEDNRPWPELGCQRQGRQQQKKGRENAHAPFYSAQRTLVKPPPASALQFFLALSHPIG